TMGPDRATDAIRKALSMGADKAVHLSDDALAGSDAVSTAKVLAKAIGTVEGVDLVLAGNEASDGRGAEVPVVVSVSEKINEPRYPSFKGIMAAKKKPVATLSLADVGVDAGEVGLAHALTTVTSASPKPPKSAGEKVSDEGDGGDKIASFLVGQKLI